MKDNGHSPLLFSLLGVFLGCLCMAWPGYGWAFEDRSLWERQEDPEHVRGPVRRLTIITKDLRQILTFSPEGDLTETISRNHQDVPEEVGERICTDMQDGER